MRWILSSECAFCDVMSEMNIANPEEKPPTQTSQSQADEASIPVPVFSQVRLDGANDVEKVIVLTPAIATFERLAKELQSLRDGSHPELQRLKREHDELKKKKFDSLEKNAEYEIKFIEQQYRCEVQSAQEELEDFRYTHGHE